MGSCDCSKKKIEIFRGRKREDEIIPEEFFLTKYSSNYVLSLKPGKKIKPLNIFKVIPQGNSDLKFPPPILCRLVTRSHKKLKAMTQ